MTNVYCVPLCAAFGQRNPESNTQPDPPSQRGGDSVPDRVVREYTQILQPRCCIFTEEVCSSILNTLKHASEAAGYTNDYPSLFKDFRGFHDLCENAVFDAILAFVQSYADVPQDARLKVDRSTLLKAWSRGESWWERLFCPGHPSIIDYNLFWRLTFELVNPTMAVLRDDVAPSIAAIMGDETLLSCLTAKTGPKASTYETWIMVSRYAVERRQKCELAATSLNKFNQHIARFIHVLEEWKRTYIIHPDALRRDVESAHSQITLLQNEVHRNTVPWTRGFQLILQALFIAHSKAAEEIAYKLATCEHSTDERMVTTPDHCDPNVVGQEDTRQTNGSAVSQPPPSFTDTSLSRPPLRVIVQDQNVTGAPSSYTMETSFEMSMADALAGNDLRDPDEAAFDTSRNERKLGEDDKQMKAAVRFNDKLGQLRKTGQVTVWTTTNEAHMSRPRKQLLSAMAHAIMRGIGVVTDETATGPEERYIFMATGEPFDLKSVIFKSARLSPCLKVIKVNLDWLDDAGSTR